MVAQSEGVGKGSTFTVRLPLTSAPGAAQDALPLPGMRHSGKPWRILVVDDNVDAADTLSEGLGACGHEVKTAHTAEAALQIFIQEPLDLAVLDIGLPGISGHELARLMRETGHNLEARFVALSGFGQEGDKERSAAAGFAAHLVKPIGFEAIDKLLAGS